MSLDTQITSTTLEIPPKWSGTNPPPSPGGFFSHRGIALRCISTLIVDGWLAVQGEPLSLPPWWNQTLEARRLWDEISSSPAKRSTYARFASSQMHWTLFGAEIDQDVRLPRTFVEHGLTARHELVALVPSILRRSGWQDSLSNAWWTGGYAMEDLEDFSGLLQTIRNTGHMAFVRSCVRRHGDIIRSARKAFASQHQR